MGHILELRKILGARALFCVGASIVAFDHNNRVLMQLRADTKLWGFPGGSSELGDSFEDTARRELLEETGLQAEHWHLDTVLSGAEYRFVYPNGDEVYNVGAIFVARGLFGQMLADNGQWTAGSAEQETLELCWFDIGTIPETQLSGPITRWIFDNLERLQTLGRAFNV